MEIQNSSQSLASNITRALAAGLVIVLMTMAAMVNYAVREEIRSTVDRKIYYLLDIEAKNASLPLWGFNKEQLQAMVDNLVLDEMITEASITNDAGELQASAGTKPGVALQNSADTKSISKKIVFLGPEKSVDIGALHVTLDYSTISHKVNLFTLQIVGLISLLLILLITSVYFITKRAIDPVTRLSRMMSNTDKTATEVISGIQSDIIEVQQLLHASRSMQQNYLTYQNELIIARDKAKAADNAKSEFLANMSHELRTPMHAILGFSRQILKRSDAITDKRLVSMIENIQISGNRLLLLLNALLDLSKLEAGKEIFDFEKADLRKAINQTLLEMDPLIQARQIHIAVHDSDASWTLSYDFKTMVQVFMNLLSNAVKFSNPGSEIHITLKEEIIDNKHMALCSVRDNGVGIPEDEIDLVFDKFVQSSKTKSGAGGTGLGLPIVRQIVESHHGRIWAENAKPNGTCFHMLLPYDHIS